jgi:hypothetical protein
MIPTEYHGSFTAEPLLRGTLYSGRVGGIKKDDLLNHLYIDKSS